MEGNGGNRRGGGGGAGTRAAAQDAGQGNKPKGKMMANNLHMADPLLWDYPMEAE